jgi:uncharacterized protein (DUF58 family)
MTPDRQELLSSDFLTRLEQLEILCRKVFVGRFKGERRSKRRGQSVEFADYRSYVPGDDLRFLDWNIYARLERLMLKLFMEEEDLNVSLLFDVSGSMDWGTPHKGLYVKRVVAALAYVGLVNLDRVSLYAWSGGLTGELTGLRGRRMINQVVAFLEGLPLQGTSNFTQAARHFAVRHKGRGVVVLLSDFLDKGGYADGLRYLLSRDLDLYLLQILSPDEINPPLAGDLRLRDVEDRQTAEVTVTQALLDRYRANLKAWCAALKDHCTRRGITYIFVSTQVPFETLVITYLRQRRLLR